MRSLAIQRNVNSRATAKPPEPMHVSKQSALHSGLGNRGMQSLLGLTSVVSGPSAVVQTKLPIGTPGDAYEQEADRIAQSVMRSPQTPSASAPSAEQHTTAAPCACGGRCAACRGDAASANAPVIQTKRISAAATSAISHTHAAMPAVNTVLTQPGQPLDHAARGFMESRFGHNFSGVRVHTDDAAAQSARALDAAAYTVGQHMVFDRGYYQPGTDAGRHLIAHELTHTLQQGATDASVGVPTIQRAMKFELQTLNIVRRVKGTKETELPRKFGPSNNRFLHKGVKGKPAKAGKEGTAIELQSEAHGFLEFETPSWLNDWCEVKQRIQEAVDMVDAISAAPVVKTVGGVDTVEFPFSTTHLKQNSKMFPKGLVSGEKLQVEIKDTDWFAKIQASESFELAQFDSYFSEYLPTSRVSAVRTNVAKLIVDANTAKLPVKDLMNLGNFMEIIVDYIGGIRRQNTNETVANEKKHLAKENISLMSRTNFASIYQHLLSKDEQTLFKKIVNSGAILTQGGLSKTDLVYPSGFTGFKSPGPTVHNWLVSIYSTKRDLMSSLGGDNRAMGRFDVETATGKKDTNLVKFEARGVSGHEQKRPAHTMGSLGGWVSFAHEVFLAAALRRHRAGKTGLTYNPLKCWWGS
jgi:hypothetical protein